MSIICQTFVQNAWRSDLCSNCFKCLADHSDPSGIKNDRISTQRYVPQAASLYQSRGISSTLKWRLSEPIYDRVARRDFGSQTPPKSEQNEKRSDERGAKSILVKNPEKKKLRSRSSVDFASEEALVIGYGGNDYDSDLSPWDMESDDGSVDLDLLDDTDEDRKITKLTKNNTEFNSSNQNLLPAENSSKRSKKEDGKRNGINNNNNNCNNHMITKSPEKSLNITYNNIQTEKKLNHYYYPSATEPLKPYLNNNNSSLEESGLKNNKEYSISLENYKVESYKRENVKISEENCKNLLNENFTPLNTRTYTFVSELNKNNTSSEHSSDSDYSTCRLTAGDSTDSESFQDAEESRIEPCPSFLHGNYPKSLSHTVIRDLDCDKKYDAGSSTSGDVSNLSDDSDTHESTERTNYKAKASRNSKSPPDVEKNKQSKELIVITSSQPDTSKSVASKNIQIRLKESTSKANIGTTITVNAKESDSKVRPPDITKDTTPTKENRPIKKSPDVVSVSVDSHYSTMIKNQENNNYHRNNPVSNKSVNLTTVTSVTGNSETPKTRSISNENKKVRIKTASTDKQPNEEKDMVCKQSQKSNSPNDQEAADKSQIGKNCDGGSDMPLLDKDQCDFDDGTSCEVSPDVIAHRQSKLAALALELELARRDSARANSVNIPITVQTTPPQLKADCSPCTPNSTSQTEHYPMIRKSATVSCPTKIAPLPDVLQETPTKTKKNRFSLKKLLKRNKDSGTFTPTGKETNPKAWKKQSFDRSRLSLEIVHPMDLTSDLATSGESTPTDDSHYGVSNHPGKGLFKGGYNRARSLSALPQISGDLNEQSNCSLLDCRKVETLPARKAGTVVERKKNRPSLVRTPSCSALPNRTPPNTAAPENSDRTPPPKPPPPPKYKVQHPPPPPPPPPPHLLKCSKTSSSSPARPPPPKIPESKIRSQLNKPEMKDLSSMDKEYANLGDIRSQLMPKKPQRPSAVSVARESEMEYKNKSDELYETLQAAEEEEDHYTYLDDAELKAPKVTSTTESVSRSKTSGETCGRPWLDLQTSYSAIAATNYESLAEIITSSMNESPDYLKIAGKSIKFKDFILENEAPQVIMQNRIICNAVYKYQEKDEIMLMIIPRKTNAHSPRLPTRYPVLASFTDNIPKQRDFPMRDVEFASVYILQRSRILTLHKFSENTMTEKNNQHIHLRNYCFILLQLIHTLKSLQAEGIEEVNFDLEHLIVVTTHEDKPPIFVLLPDDKTYLTLCETVQSRKTLCQATLGTLYHFLNISKADELKNCLVNGEQLTEPVAHTFSAIAKVLLEEKASSLTQAKGFLEYMLWGPVDVRISDSQTEDIIDTILQRWLDLQRAQMVKSTISQLQQRINSNSHMHVFEEYQLIFLLQASVKSLKNVISKL